jgi:hypothetical protein
MKVKTAYRPKSEIPAENIPTETAPTVEAAVTPAAAAAVEVRPESEPQTHAEAERHAEEIKADAAAEALKRQVEELARSEEFLRRQAQPQRPPTRQEKLASWKSQGMPQIELEFLERNPDLIDAPNLAAYSANEAAQQGHERGTEEFLQATKQIFDKHQAELQAQARSQAQTPSDHPDMKPTPDFFQPPSPKPPRPQYVPVSAPVSREPPGSRSSELEMDPRRTTLSVEERQIARASNLSDVDYARGKLELQRRKAAGEIQ